MDETTVSDPTPATVTALPFRERRRPGRVEYTNPALVALLRGPSARPDTIEIADNPLSTARGIGVGVLLAIPAWAGIAVLVWLLIG
jgi:hypothetical protein